MFFFMKQVKVSSKLSTMAALILTVSACVEFEPVSPVPAITYKSFILENGFDSLQNEVSYARLEFEFIDGDADFGVYLGDLNNPNLPDSLRYNFIIEVQDKTDGVYRPKTFFNTIENRMDTLILKQGITYDPKLDRVGQNKTVKGIIKSNTQITNTGNLLDTFRLQFYIRDRALHRSNIEVTPDYFIEQ